MSALVTGIHAIRPRPGPPALRTALIAATVVAALASQAAPAVAADTTKTTPAVQMANLAATAVSTLQSERSTAPNNNGSSMFPTATNLALAQLTFRSSVSSVRADMGVPLAAIANFLVTGNTAMKNFAVDTIEVLLSNQRQANGSLYSLPTGGDIDTMAFADHLGMAVLELGDELDAAHRASFASAVAGAADFLIANGNLSWYTNGNIVVGNALTIALAYQLTGSSTYLNYYQRAIDFAVSPDQVRWPGFGFVITKKPLKADGSDGRGYFAEAGATPGYDGDYTMLQSEQLSRLYLATHDAQVLRLLNMVTNQLLSRTNTATWIMDSSYGTRHDYPREILDTSAIATLAFKGGRVDLQPYVAGQTAVIDTEFRQALTQQVPLGDRFLYAVGMIPLSIILAAGGSSAPTIAKIPVVKKATAIRIASGSRASIDHSGNAWVTDARYARGGMIATTSRPIAGTQNPKLYSTVRFGVMSYRIPVAAGTYQVTVGMAEQYFGKRKARVFDVTSERHVVVKNVDAFAKAGKFHACNVRFTVKVKDRVLDVGFVNHKNVAAVSYIMVVRVGP
jgi:hypothetical protein